jgi:hypothetical protein
MTWVSITDKTEVVVQGSNPGKDGRLYINRSGSAETYLRQSWPFGTGRISSLERRWTSRGARRHGSSPGGMGGMRGGPGGMGRATIKLKGIIKGRIGIIWLS